MLAIRFARVGKKNKAQYRIVLQEHTVAPGGRHVEVLGSYDPHLKNAIIREDRVKYWISKGAQASDTAYNLFVSKGIIEGEKRKVKLPNKTAPEVASGEVKAEGEAKKESVEKPAEEVKAEEPKKEEPKAEKAEEPKKEEDKK
jgi:small subunit ribosomal protein S16